ncbi:MAG: hypothetical protein R2727_02745 [Bacteroidales bacterium]
MLLHQTIIGEEALKQMEIACHYPDIVVGVLRRRIKLRREYLFRL